MYGCYQKYYFLLSYNSSFLFSLNGLDYAVLENDSSSSEAIRDEAGIEELLSFSKTA